MSRLTRHMIFAKSHRDCGSPRCQVSAQWAIDRGTTTLTLLTRPWRLSRRLPPSVSLPTFSFESRIQCCWSRYNRLAWFHPDGRSGIDFGHTPTGPETDTTTGYGASPCSRRLQLRLLYGACEPTHHHSPVARRLCGQRSQWRVGLWRSPRASLRATLLSRPNSSTCTPAARHRRPV
jgi:hypothetical protein